MPAQPAQPIPQDLAYAFRDAVRKFPDSEFGDALIRFRGESEKATAICYMTMVFGGAIPPTVFADLCAHISHGHHDDHILKDVLAYDPTYPMAARCLLQLIESRKTQQALLEQIRDSRK